MKKAVLTIGLVLVALMGCKQPQEPKAGAGNPGVAIKSPEEIRQLEDMAKQSPGNGAAWTALGNALMDSNRFGEAITAYQKALAIDPKNVDVRVDMGTCLKNSGQPEKAAEEFRKAAKINPNHPYAHRNLGVVLAWDLKDKKDAIKEFEKYLQLSPYAADSTDIRQAIETLKGQK